MRGRVRYSQQGQALLLPLASNTFASTVFQVSYYQAAELCILDWSATAAYSLTLAVLIICPSASAILFTYCAIFSAMRNTHTLEDSQRMLLETDHNFAMTFFVLIAFCLSWLPVIVVRAMPETMLGAADSATVNFVFVWLAIGGPSSKLLISLFINREFRSALGSLIPSFCPCCAVSASEQRRQQYRNLSTEQRTPFG
uniref:G-protein coupled receptors family 1 profile domain-containing protein n=1 Tax=Parascaris univalens TaxID=6257 RepID=A0A915AT99_PARUN